MTNTVLFEGHWPGEVGGREWDGSECRDQPYITNSRALASRFSLVCAMDNSIDLTDANAALDLANIRFQLMYLSPPPPSLGTTLIAMQQAGWRTPSYST